MQKSKIEWTDYSWNPIKGICPVGCWYCYGRRMYQRFKLDPKPWLDIAELNQVAETRLTGKRIFVCSTFELFHPIVDGLMGRCIENEKKWQGKARDLIFNVIERRPDLTFIILTKMPERIDRPMPDNVWLGVSLTGENSREYDRIPALAKTAALTKFVSFEPLFRGFDVWELFDEFIPDWIIVGRLTGYGTQRDTPRRAIRDIIDYAVEENIRIFLKNNLKEIWGKPLIQESPSVKVSDAD